MGAIRALSVTRSPMILLKDLAIGHCLIAGMILSCASSAMTAGVTG